MLSMHNDKVINLIQLYLFGIGAEIISVDVSFHLLAILSLDYLNSLLLNVTFTVRNVPIAVLQLSKNNLTYLIVSFHLDTGKE